VKSLLALLGVLIMLDVAGLAHGDPGADNASDPDSAFLASLQAAGITYKRVDQAILSAKSVCRFIGNGKPSPEVLAELRIRNPDLTIEHATQFVGIAVQSYCPDQLVPRGDQNAQ
jgi:hypothetical protein